MITEWISVKDRVPNDRREVLTWGRWTLPSCSPKFLGVTRYNPGSCFDNENGRFILTVVTHWAEITGPANV